MNLADIMKPIEDLYEYTKTDWSVNISLSFTEPVCATIRIRPDYSNTTRYMTYTDGDIKESLEKLVERVRLEIIEGKDLGAGGVPFTNSDDSILDCWFEGRKANPNLEFPAIELYQASDEYKEMEERNRKRKEENDGELPKIIFGND